MLASGQIIPRKFYEEINHNSARHDGENPITGGKVEGDDLSFETHFDDNDISHEGAVPGVASRFGAWPVGFLRDNAIACARFRFHQKDSKACCY